MKAKIKLTEISPGAGCGCKIAPDVLEHILDDIFFDQIEDENLIIGNKNKDDASVYKLNDKQALVSTTDFFTPIVDDPYYFGKIAATNALSDIYAMGATPITALAILAWPLNKLPVEQAKEVFRGATEVAKEAGIRISGGHSIDIGDPVFGLAVNGLIDIDHIKSNENAKEGDLIFLTKRIGVGILSTAIKRGILSSEHETLIMNMMSTLNKQGMEYGKQSYVHAMTDVTGFGIAGHLAEVCEASGVTADLDFQKIPLIDGLDFYIEQKSFPGGTFRNYNAYGHKLDGIDEMRKKVIVCDPQTSGGLLVFVDKDFVDEFKALSQKIASDIFEVGRVMDRGNNDKIVRVR